jgi:hypothetical protein
MSSPTRKGATQNPREVDQGPRRSIRTIKKQPGSHPRRPQEHQTKRPVTSEDVQMPKIVKSPSSSQKQKLDILHSPKKIILQSSRAMRIVLALRAICHPKSHFGDLQTFHQELKTSLMQWDYMRNLNH